jgi:hypothetical protein
MVVYYGTRFGGAIERCHGQYAATKFFHLYWLPLFPISGTLWITQQNGDGFHIHPRRFSWKSLLAAYLRSWGLIFGALSVIFSLVDAFELALLVFGLLLLGGALASWRWSSLSVNEMKRRELFHLLSGTYCAPEHLTDDMASTLKDTISVAWQKHFPTRTPNDAARFGAKDIRESLYAFSLLSLQAREASGQAQRDLLQLADQIVQGTASVPSSFSENPYRVAAEHTPEEPRDEEPIAPQKPAPPSRLHITEEHN